MTNILHRLWPRRRAADRITIGVHVVTVPKPIALAERSPGAGDIYGGGVWFGFWDQDGWIWDYRERSACEHTHWLPNTVEVLPARCCPPEVEA